LRVAWIPVEGGKRFRCEVHDLTFKRGQACAVCSATGSRPVDDGPRQPHAPPSVHATNPSLAEHEVWFIGLSEEAADMARGEEAGSTAAKLFDTAIKARRAAAAIAKWREDFAAARWTEGQVEELKKLRDGQHRGGAEVPN
jgi:hypothetical protein